MRVALLPSTQKGNPVLGGGSEADYAQDIARKLIPLLKDRGHQCASFAGAQDANSDGANAAVAWGPDFSFSIHSDAGYAPNSHNAALMCYQAERSKAYAQTVLKGYCSRMGFTSRGLQVRTPGTNGVAVIRIPEKVCPAILLEATWHDRDPDASNLRDSNYRYKMALAMCGALCDYIGGTSPVTKEDDEGMVYGKEFMSADGKTFDFPNCWRDKYNYFVFTSGSWTDLKFEAIDENGNSGKTVNGQTASGKNKVHNMQTIMGNPEMQKVKGSYRLVVTSTTPCNISLREAPK